VSQDGPRFASVGKKILKDKCLTRNLLYYKTKSQEIRENSERGRLNEEELHISEEPSGGQRKSLGKRSGNIFECNGNSEEN
jgi:hypothetical protein